jgi:hypothetical protein
LWSFDLKYSMYFLISCFRFMIELDKEYF